MPTEEHSISPEFLEVLCAGDVKCVHAFIASGVAICANNKEAPVFFNQLDSNFAQLINSVREIDNTGTFGEALSIFERNPHSALAQRILRIFLRKMNVTLLSSQPIFFSADFFKTYPETATLWASTIQDHMLFPYFAPYFDFATVKEWVSQCPPVSNGKLNRSTFDRINRLSVLISELRKANLTQFFMDNSKHFQAFKRTQSVGVSSLFSGSNRLFNAISKGDLEGLYGRLLESERDINCRDGQHNTPLLLAVETDHAPSTVEIMIHLLRIVGAGLAIRNGAGETALMVAVRKNAYQIAPLLIDEITVNLGNFSHRTPLLVATFCRYSEMVLLLLAAGADPNLADKAGDTPLIWAAKWGNAGIIKAFIAARAKVDHQNALGEDALFWARAYHHEECVHILSDATLPFMPAAASTILSSSAAKRELDALCEGGLILEIDSPLGLFSPSPVSSHFSAVLERPHTAPPDCASSTAEEQRLPTLRAKI